MLRISCFGFRIWAWLAAITMLACAGCSARKGNRDHDVVHLKCLSAGGLNWHQLYAQCIQTFGALHPGIRVELIENSAQGNKFQVMVAGGTPPDIAVFSQGDFINYAAQGHLLDLTPLMAADPTFRREHYYERVMETGEVHGRQYGLPCYFSTIVLYYNKNLFDAAGLKYPDDTWTWDTFLEAAQKLTVDRDGDGRIDQYGFLVALGVHRWPIFVWQNGGEVVDDQRGLFVLDSPEAIEAIQFYADLVNRHRVSPPPTEYQSMSIDAMFMTGRAAMTIQSRYQLSFYQHIRDFDWDVAVLPRGKRRATAFISSLNAISKSTRHPKEAWEFVKFLSSLPAYEVGAAIMNSIPALKAAAESPLILNPDIPPAHDRAFIDMIPFGHIPNFDRLAPGQRDKFDRLYQEMDHIWLGRKSAAEVLKQAVPKLNQHILAIR